MSNNRRMRRDVARHSASPRVAMRAALPPRYSLQRQAPLDIAAEIGQDAEKDATSDDRPQIDRDAFDQLEEMDAQTGVAPGDAGSGMPFLGDKPSGWRPDEG